jgi:hypothetical protein
MLDDVLFGMVRSLVKEGDYASALSLLKDKTDLLVAVGEEKGPDFLLLKAHVVAVLYEYDKEKALEESKELEPLSLRIFHR